MDEASATIVRAETDFEMRVPWKLVQEVPEDIRSNTEQLESYLIRALEIGLKAMAQAGVHIDTDFVRAEFARFAEGLTTMRVGLEKVMAAELTAEDSKLARGLREYLADDGRLGRMVRELAKELGDPEREGSIPGRICGILDKNFAHADSPFQRALNISDDRSPLKQFVTDQDKKISDLREDRTKKHTDLSKIIDSCFQKVFDHIGYKSALDEAEEKGTRKGLVFEDQLVEVVAASAINKDTVERVGEEMVDGTRVKRGDVLIHVEQDAFDPDRIVVEAKAGAFTLRGKDGLLTQLSDAMAYRNAGAGIAVVTKLHAGKRQRVFDRQGSNRVVVVVDPEDDISGYLPLECAYAVMRDALLARKTVGADTGPSLDAAEDTINQIENSLNAVQSMKRNCTEARKNIDSVRDAVEIVEGDIREKLKTLRRQLGR